MKISQTSVSLLIVAWLFAVLTFYFAQTSEQIRIDEEFQKTEEARIHLENTGERKPIFWVSDQPTEFNYADYLVIGFLILTSSTIVAAIWFWKRE
jgi:hypothetical protein